MKVKIVNRSAYPTPAYATEKSAGMDLKANITEPVTLGPLERAMIPTGLFIALPIRPTYYNAINTTVSNNNWNVAFLSGYSLL